jgi:enediyne biosynthesis protein E4
MSQSVRIAVIFMALIGVGAVAAVGIWYGIKPKPDPLHGSTTSAMRECAAEVGIKFQMHFLPNEQGETFKINLYDHGCGLAVGDFDGDGYEDIYFVNQLGPNALYRNRGDGTFEDVTEKAGVALGDRICVGATFVDYDNDGKLDLFVTSTRGGNVLFRNMGDGKFKDVTKEAGLTYIGHSQTAVFFDFDNDGHLDLFLANTAEWTTENFDKSSRYFVGKGADGFGQVIHSKKEANVLYRNNGNGTFTDVTEKAGLKGLGWAADAVAFDYNGDGRMDLFVTNMFGRCQLYRNNGNGSFTDVTLEVLGKTPWGGMGAKLIDHNSDGRLDLFVVDMHSDMWTGPDFKHEYLDWAKKYEKKKFRYYYGPRADRDPLLIEEEKQLGREIGFKHEELLFGNAFFRNEGGGKFSEISDQAGLETFWPWGMAIGDFDNDGHEDIFIPSGMGYPFYYWPNALMMNQGDGTFRDRAADFGIEPPARGVNLPKQVNGKDAVRSSRCAVTGDFAGSGRLDIVVNNFNDQPYFFKNQFPQKNYIAFRLQGTVSNRDAIGAVVRLYRGDKILTRQVQGACGYLSQSSKTVHFGLGDSADFDRVEITWPNGQLQRLDKPAPNTLHQIVQPKGDQPLKGNDK